MQLNAQRERAMHWKIPGQNGLDFSNGFPVNSTSTIPNTGIQSMNTTTMSDENGNLLFYSNGTTIWNSSNVVMTNGSGLNGNVLATQNVLAVPYPNNPDRYFLFTMSEISGPGLHSYIVDPTIGNGLVIPMGQLDTVMCEKLCATKHANDFDYWVLTHKMLTDTFIAYHIDSFGISNTVISKVGLVHSGNGNAAKGQMKFSPDGTKVAVASFAGGHMQLFRFDNETGIVSHPLTLENFTANFPFGVEFSPDSRKVYYNQRFSAFPTAKIFQYDLDHLDTNCLLDSKFILGSLDNTGLKIPSNMQLGIDGRIYLSTNYFPTYDTLGVINHPNLLGPDADLEVKAHPTSHAITEGLTSLVSTFVSDGIHVVFGTTCEGLETVMFPEDTLSPDSVFWDFGDPNSSSNTSTLIKPSHLYSTSDTFTITLVTYRNAGTIIDTFLRNVVIWDIDSNHAGNDTTICSTGSPAVLDGSWYNSCLYWSTGATSSTISVSTEGWYWVDVYYQSCYFRDSIYVEEVNGPPVFDLGPDTSVCNSFSFIIDPNLPNAYYTWQDGSHDTTFQVTQTGIHSLSATNACGTTSDNLSVTVNITAQPVLNFPADTTLCDTMPWLVDVTFDDASYLWSDGSSAPQLEINSPGQYWVRVSNICDTISDTVNVSIDSLSIVELPNKELICNTSDDQVTLVANLHKPLAFWSDGSNARLFNATKPGVYWATISNACGVSSDTIEVLLWDTGYQFSLGRDTVICDSSTSIKLGWSDDLYPFAYNWENGSDSQFVTAPAGIYALTISNRCETLSDYKYIRVAPRAFIDKPNNQNICEGEVFQVFLVNADSSDIYWSTTEISDTIMVEEPGVYSVKITDKNGCIFLDTLSLGEDCPAKVYAPNVFTPNDDFINDEYCLGFDNVVSSETMIFNRWGTLIFQTTQIDQCWDGIYNEHPASEGVYYYQVTIEDINGKKTTFKGSFSLLR
ncbi:MAG: gliding motility-associated C-terminal domain-containing protein [Flavobacteriales bacterium]